MTFWAEGDKGTNSDEDINNATTNPGPSKTTSEDFVKKNLYYFCHSLSCSHAFLPDAFGAGAFWAGAFGPF